MKALRPLVLVLAATATPLPAAAAEPVQSGDSACVWAATPQPTRAALIAMVARSSLQISDAVSLEQAQGIATACHLPMTGDSARLIAVSLRANALMTYGAEGLKAHGASDAALEAAWDRVSPATRLTFAGAFSEGFRPSEAQLDELGAAGGSLKLDSDVAKAMFFDFILGRAVLARLGRN